MSLTQTTETEIFNYDDNGNLAFHRKDTLTGTPAELQEELDRQITAARAESAAALLAEQDETERQARISALQSVGIADVTAIR